MQLVTTLRLFLATTRFGREEGQGATEYVGIIVLVALILVAIFGLGLDETISGALSDAVDDAIGGE